MQLTKLLFERYKCFKKRDELEVRPLTILIGRNSSGKSVLARLPLLLGHALSGRATAPIDLDVDGLDFGASFVDLVHGRSAHGSIGLGFEVQDDGDTVQTWFEVQHIDEQKLQVVRSLLMNSTTGTAVKLDWTGPNAPGELATPRYVNGNGDVHDLTFSGFLAQGLGDSKLKEDLTHLANLSRRAFAHLRYLGPFREIPRRAYRFPGGTIRDVGVSGGQAPAALGADYLRNEGIVLGQVAQFYTDHLGGWQLDVDNRGDTFSLVLRRARKDEGINLVDAGVGLSQVLPLVVQRFLDAGRLTGSYLEIVEQPELHLHPGAHAALADLYIASVTKTRQARFIIETHSEVILLRIRRRIAEGTLSPDHVALYWLQDDPSAENPITPIRIGRDGSVDVWPRGVFSENFREVQAIERARKASD